MADVPPGEEKKGLNADEPQPTVSALTNDNATAQVPVTLPNQQPPAKKPRATGQQEQQGDTQLASKYMSANAARVMNHLGVKALDPHLQEMLKDKEARVGRSAIPGGLEITLDAQHALFVATLLNKDVIGVAGGGKVDAKAAKAMVGIAKSKDWKTVYITGSSSIEEKEAVWLECKRQGVQLGNFEPKPDSAVAEKWREEQKNGGPEAKITNADPDQPMKNTLNLIKNAGAAAKDDPALIESLHNMFDKVRNGNLHVDENVAKKIAEALSDKHPGREGFNLAAQALNNADPALKIAPLETAPVEAGPNRPGPRISQAARTTP